MSWVCSTHTQLTACAVTWRQYEKRTETSILCAITWWLFVLSWDRKHCYWRKSTNTVCVNNVMVGFEPLKDSGYYIYIYIYIYIPPYLTLRNSSFYLQNIFISLDSHNRQVFPRTVWAGWSLKWKCSFFSVQQELSLFVISHMKWTTRTECIWVAECWGLYWDQARISDKITEKNCIMRSCMICTPQQKL
jgi:hypothetical protein